jgi:16S rRNA (guanine966-N2)-methyltransferase
VRVVAGEYGGRRLKAPAGDATRPTTDRVREAVFSTLGPLDGARVLDLFAGSGALGIEALSRGAAHTRFVEQARPALVVLKANLATLDIDSEAASVRAGDALAALRDASTRGDAYDLVFLDPPYRQATALGPALSTALTPVLAPGARVVSESDRRHPLDLDLPLVHERRYGDTLIRIFQP